MFNMQTFDNVITSAYSPVRALYGSIANAVCGRYMTFYVLLSLQALVSRIHLATVFSDVKEIQSLITLIKIFNLLLPVSLYMSVVV